MKKSKAILIVFIVLFFSYGFTILGYKFYNAYEHRVLKTKIYYMNFTSDYAIGFVPLKSESDVLQFGIVPPFGSSTKELSLYNSYDFKVLTNFTVNGSISRYIDINPENDSFILDSSKAKKFTIVAHSPINESWYNQTNKTFEKESFEGYLTIQFRKFPGEN